METRGSVPDLQADKAIVFEWCGLKSSEFFHHPLDYPAELADNSPSKLSIFTTNAWPRHTDHTLIFVNRTSMHKRIT